MKIEEKLVVLKNARQAALDRAACPMKAARDALLAAKEPAVYDNVVNETFNGVRLIWSSVFVGGIFDADKVSPGRLDAIARHIVIRTAEIIREQEAIRAGRCASIDVETAAWDAVAPSS